MKVVYAFPYNPASRGVLNKIDDKLHFISATGVNLTALAISPNDVTTSEIKYPAQFANSSYNPPKIVQFGPLKIIATLLRKRYAAKFLEREIGKLNPDVVLMRYGYANPFVVKLMKRYPIVFEHNTKELEELELSFDGIRKSGWEKATNYWLEKYFAAKVIRNAAGIVGVTTEITNYELNRAGKKIPALTLGNGIDFNRIPFTSGPAYNGGTLHLLLLSSVAVSWHGVDRLLKGIGENDDVHLWLAGKFTDTDIQLAQKCKHKVTFTGMLKGDQLDELFGKVHLAVASLAINRKGLTEMSALKVREYAARGVPFVTAFDDPDLPDGVMPEGSGWLRITQKDEPVNMQALSQFALTAASAENRKRLRVFAEQQMNYSQKMKVLVEFLSNVLK
jgi:Glycosyl transferases group 1